MEVKTLNKSFNKVINEARNDTLNKLFEFLKDNKSIKIDDDELDDYFKDFKKNNTYNHKIFNDGKKKNGSLKTKREPTKYNKFVSIRIKEIRKAHDDKIDNNEAMKLVGADWKKLSDDDKKNNDIDDIIKIFTKLEIKSETKKSPKKK